MSATDRSSSLFSKSGDEQNESASTDGFLIDFTPFPRNAMFYGGDAGQKYDVSAFGQNWIIKFPKSMADFAKPQRSYTTSPLSEYIGSHIYELLGHDVHETKLGIRDGKLVVACRDFLAPGERLIEFKNIKNAHITTTSSGCDQIVTSGGGTDLEEVLYTIDADETLRAAGAKERFWDMFVVDAFIGNNDRNNMNWALIGDAEGSVRLAPIYDNGNAFFNKRSDEVMAKRATDTKLIEEDALEAFRSTYLQPGSDHHINPFEYMSSGNEPELMAAMERFTETLNMDAIRSFISSIPAVDNGTVVLGEGQRRFYLALLEIRASNMETLCEGKKDLARIVPSSPQQTISRSPGDALKNATRSAQARNTGQNPPNRTQNRGR